MSARRTPFLSVAAAALLAGCAHAPPPAHAAPAAAPKGPALVAAVGEASYPDLDGSYQVPQVADAACLAPAALAEAHPATPGRVVLRFAVAADGTVDDDRVLANSAGAPLAALRALASAVKACRWIPARDPQGRRVRVYVQLPFEFAEAGRS
jgi:TonB family protein